jgi:hypothetical protein
MDSSSSGDSGHLRIFDTIRLWADGQNALNAETEPCARAMQRAVNQALNRLYRHGSLADLAAAYHESDVWWSRLAEEHELDAAGAGVVRDAAYWQRFMQIRHPTWREDRVR